MKYVFPIILLCCFLNSPAQKDKTLNWVLPQKHEGNVFVTVKSVPTDKDYYEGFQFVPKAAKILHFSVNASLFSSNSFNPKYQSFGLQIKTKNKIFVNEVVQGKGTYNIPLSTTDTITVYFIAHPPANDTTNFSYNYIIADTAALGYNNQEPQAVFEEMLRLANTGYINLYNSDKINYPTGLFSPNPATRNRWPENVIQYTGKDLESAPADKIINEWNKKIKTWLSDYNVTDVKKNMKGDYKLDTDEEETVYTKKNAQGLRLFTVTVFKKRGYKATFYGDDDDSSCKTGVRISN